MRRLCLALVVSLGVVVAAAPTLKLPMKEGSTRFAVIGDTGTGDSHQAAIGKALFEAKQSFPFSFVLMMGDNLYGGDTAKDYQKKFEVPYKSLLDSGVKFYAS